MQSLGGNDLLDITTMEEIDFIMLNTELGLISIYLTLQCYIITLYVYMCSTDPEQRFISRTNFT